VKLMTEVLFKDLATNEVKSELINLKELRDQLLGRRINSGLVFMWGINDDRTCKKQRESKIKDAKDPNDSNINALIPPTQIEFDDQVKIVKIKCGGMHTLGLSSEGQVYGWGFSKSGALGIGVND
jgi:alpha-tubulin suppressor-like RCC1 family protein